MEKKTCGFTLIELIIVIAIFGIFAVVAVPRLMGFSNRAEESVCATNRKSVEKMYATYLIGNDNDHMDSIFNQYRIDNFDEICSAGGVISYADGKVKCSIHGSVSDGEEEEGPGEDVPWL